MKRLVLALMLGAALASPAMADTITITGGGGGYGIWQTGSGGEFTLQINDVAGAPQLDLSAYVALTENQGGVLNSFQTFCIEENEFAYPNSTYNATVDQSAIKGGVGGGSPDPVSLGTAWLYRQFANGTLATYDYTNTGAGRNASAQDLQNAIWFLEDEGGANNAFVAAAILNNGGTLAAAKADGGGAYNVYALNLKADFCPGGLCQSMLYASVPDGGTTLMLLGSALVGIAGFRRKFNVCRKFNV